MSTEREPLEVRPARPADSETITRTLRDGMDAAMLAYTIFSARGVERFVYDTLTLRGAHHGTLYTVATRSGEVAGFTEFRRSMDQVFLNHIYVRADFRGGGVGGQLLRESIRLARDYGQQRIALDVFADNRRAHRWYESLGFRTQSSSEWTEAELPPCKEPGCARGHVDGLAAARLSMDRYGFCNFQVATSLHSYGVGKIGPHLFRATTSDLLEDRDALGLLSEMDPRARLLCISERPSAGNRYPFHTRVVGRSYRLAAEADGVLAALARQTGNEC